jgi:hypothetical protein
VLADAGLADEHHKKAVTAPRFIEFLRQGGDLVATADEGRDGEHRKRVVLVAHLVRLHGRGDALEGERAEVIERVVLASVEQARYEVAGDDLACLRLVAEAPGDDDGGAEVIRLVAERLADVEAGADLEALAGGGAARRLLHGDGAADCIARGVERDHEAVAEPLHLVSAMGGDGLAKQSVVRLEDALGQVVARALEQLGRVDEVGEEDGDGLGPGGHRAAIVARAAPLRV